MHLACGGLFSLITMFCSCEQTQVHEFYRGDPYDINANTGVFGRMLDKLKLQGYQTSANACGDGGEMLTGDQQYNNPVYGVSTKAPQTLNQDPTIENIYEVVKELNGVGEADSNVMSETWSTRVAASLYEHEQMQLIAGMPEFDITSYGEDGDGGESLGGSFKAIIEFMKSRHFRKVDREVYILKQSGYDHHSENAVSDLFKIANDAIVDFVNELKNQGLWQSTVLIMASDFGRSLNPNSNAGTDHAWGGNYFVAGGSVAGGRVLGKYPSPLSPEHPNWIGRGRFIPTTPWDSVFNAVSEWYAQLSSVFLLLGHFLDLTHTFVLPARMGVRGDPDLDWILPNRNSFDTCTDLFHDKVRSTCNHDIFPLQFTKRLMCHHLYTSGSLHGWGMHLRRVYRAFFGAFYSCESTPGDDMLFLLFETPLTSSL